MEVRQQRPPSPPWKIRTRPCPFYSSGRCLFSDSCNFRHVVKSPLTPIDYPSIRKSLEISDTYNILDDDAYQRADDEESSRDWSKSVKSTPPITGTHSREPSSQSYITTSPTETGTVRGRRSLAVSQEFHDITLVEEEKVMGLGLMNMHEVRRIPQQPVPLANLGSHLSHEKKVQPYLSVSEPPFAFSVQKGASLSLPQPAPAPAPVPLPASIQEIPATLRRLPSRSDSGGQELEVNFRQPRDLLNLATPTASSLIQNRVRKNTVSGQPPASIPVFSHLTATNDESGSPTITLKRLAEANNAALRLAEPEPDSLAEFGFKQTEPSPSPSPFQPSPSPFLEPPDVDDEEDEPSSSRAKERFHRAYKLVTNELRQRVAHLRRSPTSPDHFDPSPAPVQVESPKPVRHNSIRSVHRHDSIHSVLRQESIRSVNRHESTRSIIIPRRPSRDQDSEDEAAVIQNDSPSYLDDYLGGEPAEGSLNEAKEVEEPVSARPWLKPLRLSTLGSQLFSTTSQQSSALDSGRSPLSLPPTRSSSPVKRQSSPFKRPVSAARKSSQNSRQDSRQNSRPNSRQNSRKSTLDALTSGLFPGSPFMDSGPVPPVPPIFTSPAVESSRAQRSGSVHYIHSPSPTRWTPSSPQPRTTELLPTSARSVSPTRASRASPSPIEPTRKLSLRPKSAAPSQATSTPPLPTERPKLFFAIASNKPDEVARLLATGEASPNETVGPQDMHALTFAMENMAHGDPAKLPQMEEVVTTLLSYGADPAVLEGPGHSTHSSEANPLVNYFLEKAHRSPIPTQPSKDPNEDEIPLRRAKFAIVGQEFGLQELARAYAAHTRLARFLVEEDGDPELPFVAIFAGLSGHGKTLLASRVGGLLGVPTYTINTTLIKGYADLWSASSSHAREHDEHSSLREFLHAHDRQRAVVIIDEIEKIHDPALLQSLLVPWETGRLREGTFSRTVDVSKTIWLCTSNIGCQDILRSTKDVGALDAASFDTLAKQTRSHLRDALGASLVARVSTVVPFVPFSPEERLAISSKCLSAMRHKLALSRTTILPTVQWDGVLQKAANEYVEAEGARSIRRSILRLVDAVLHDV